MPGTKDITRRIKSVKNTSKITKAMEMVSSSKMRRAVAGVLATRPYSNLAWRMVLNIAQKTDVNLHPLLVKREPVKNVGIVLITSNRGLCGSFNQQAIKVALDYIKTNKEANYEFIALGSKGGKAMVKMGKKVVADFAKADVLNEVREIWPLSQMITKDYLAGKYDRVVLIYTDFISALRQMPRLKQILPLEPVADMLLGQVGNQENKKTRKQENKDMEGTEYLFEPSPKLILNELLPRLLEVQIYQALLESNASEHSARMLAMRNASDAASDMINELTLAYNQARQAVITREIAEIAGGKAALE
jgi:F-type H+-transporting ATPase subunit gamma